MLGLTLRDEFRGKRLKGTAIELSNDTNTGATQIAAQKFLEITYPTHDLLKGIEAVGPNQGRSVVVIGERGLGKSHLMAALYHAVNDPTSTGAWLNSWATTLAYSFPVIDDRLFGFGDRSVLILEHIGPQPAVDDGLVGLEHIVPQTETRVQEGLVIIVGRVQVLEQPEQASAVEIGQSGFDVTPRD